MGRYKVNCECQKQKINTKDNDNDNETITDDKVISDHFNKFFGSVAVKFVQKFWYFCPKTLIHT